MIFSECEICFQGIFWSASGEHLGKFALGGEDGPRALFGFFQPKDRYQVVSRNGNINLAQITLEKSRIKGIELFGLRRKCKAVLEIVDSSYTIHTDKD